MSTVYHSAASQNISQKRWSTPAPPQSRILSLQCISEEAASSDAWPPPSVRPGTNGQRSPSVSSQPPPDARPPRGRRRRTEEDATVESGAEVCLPLEQHAVVDAELAYGQLDVEATQLLEGAEDLEGRVVRDVCDREAAARNVWRRPRRWGRGSGQCLVMPLSRRTSV
jgi:hypothetical protein